MKKNKPFISIVIPSYNSWKTVGSCLESLIDQNGHFDYEIIVIDSSNDKTSLLLKKFPSVTSVHLETKTPPGKARNMGILRAKGEIIMFLDADCIAGRDWLMRGVESINKGYDIIGGAVGNGNSFSFISFADYILTFNEFTPYMPKKEVDFLPSTTLVCSRRIFETIGFFEEELEASEDVLFTHQVHSKFRILFNPSLIVSHYNRNTFKEFMSHQYNFGKYAALVRKRHTLSDYFYAKHPIFSPLVPFARIARISLRMFQHNNKLLWKYFLSFPFFLLGIISWGTAYVLYGAGIHEHDCDEIKI